MNVFKRWPRTLVALILVLAMFFVVSPTAEAETRGSITYRDKSSKLKRTVRQYKVLDFQPGATPGKGSYTVPEKLRDAYITFLRATVSTANGQRARGLVLGLSQSELDGLKVNSVINANALNNAVQKAFSDPAKFTDFLRRDFAEAILAAAKRNGIAYDDVNMHGSAIIAGVDLGYYVIEDITELAQNYSTPSLRSLVMLTTTNPEAEVNIKAPTHREKKEILDNYGNVLAISKSKVGDEIRYRYTTTLPDELHLYKRYSGIFIDTLPSGLVLKPKTKGSNDYFTVTIGNIPLKQGTKAEVEAGTADYYIEYQENQDEKTDAKIYFTPLQKGVVNQRDATKLSAKELKIEYTTIVTKFAPEWGARAIENSAVFKFSDDPAKDDGGNPKGETFRSWTYSYYAALEIFKTNEKGQNLPGAEFTLTGNGITALLTSQYELIKDPQGPFYLLKDGTTTREAPTPATADQYESTTDKYQRIENSVRREASGPNGEIISTTNETGRCGFSGLTPGKYTLTETKAPKGYNLLSEPIEFTISEPTINSYDPSQPKWTFTVTKPVGVYTFTGNNFDGNKEITIVNKQGSVIPGLGGTGTTLLYVLGSAVAIASAIYIVSKKRADEKTR